jgi:release factor glutamine methyltransferase
VFAAQFTQTVRTILLEARQRLENAGCASPALDARLLLAEVLGVSQEALLTNPEQCLSSDTLRDVERLIQRREKREPIAYILGVQEFWGHAFVVDHHTLIPRPDTETLIEAVLSLIPEAQTPLRVLDLGTGSGCLLLTLLAHYPLATGVGVDQSEGALAVARENAQRLGVLERAQLLRSDWDKELSSIERFSLVVSNPPYIPCGQSLMPDVAAFEPEAALFAGEDGLAEYRRLAAIIPHRLVPEGIAVLEAGSGQAEAIKEIFESQGMIWQHNVADLQGIERAVVFKKL